MRSGVGWIFWWREKCLVTQTTTGGIAAAHSFFRDCVRKEAVESERDRGQTGKRRKTQVHFHQDEGTLTVHVQSNTSKRENTIFATESDLFFRFTCSPFCTPEMSVCRMWDWADYYFTSHKRLSVTWSATLTQTLCLLSNIRTFDRRILTCDPQTLQAPHLSSFPFCLRFLSLFCYKRQNTTHALLTFGCFSFNTAAPAKRTRSNRRHRVAFSSANHLPAIESTTHSIPLFLSRSGIRKCMLVTAQNDFVDHVIREEVVLFQHFYHFSAFHI